MAFRRFGIEDEMEEEIRSHLEMAAEDYRREGIDAEMRGISPGEISEASSRRRSDTAICTVSRA